MTSVFFMTESNQINGISVFQLLTTAVCSIYHSVKEIINGYENKGVHVSFDSL